MHNNRIMSSIIVMNKMTRTGLRKWQRLCLLKCFVSLSSNLIILPQGSNSWTPTILEFHNNIHQRSTWIHTAHPPLYSSSSSLAESSPVSVPLDYHDNRKVQHRKRDSRLYMTSSSSSIPAATSSSTSSVSLTAQENITEYSDIDSWDDDIEDEMGISKIESNNDDDDDEEEGEPSSIILDEYERWSNAIDQAVATLNKKRTSLESELSKAQNIEETMARAQLLVSNLYMFTEGVRKATIIDWENNGIEVELVVSDEYDSASAEADALFNQARKLKRGSQIVYKLLEETAEAWDLLQSAQEDLQSAYDGQTINEGRFGLIKDRLMRTARITNFQIPSVPDDNKNQKQRNQKNNNRRERKPEVGTPASNVRKLQSPSGCTVLVGRNRRGNEYISLTIARGNDIWMHSRGCPGAHVLIQNRRGSPPVTEEDLQFGANLAIFYSDSRNEKKAEVTAAEPKHVLKPRGAPLGAVKIREEWKTFVGRPDCVPDELKIAREQSGQTNEYHMLDKAKHRRRTKQVAEEDQLKRRQKYRDRKNQ